MLELPHVIVGATIATTIGQPALALPLAILSNFILDIIPHWNPHLFTEVQNKKKLSHKSLVIVLIDASLGLIIGLFLAFRFYPDLTKVIYILSGSLLASIADLVEAPYFFLNVKNRYLLKLIHLQRSIQVDVPIVPGLLTQIILVGSCLWLILH